MINQALRLFVLLVGLSVMSVGIALSVHSRLGTTPISTFPLVLGYIFSLSVGTMTIIVNLAFVLAQILIRGRRFQPVQLFQIPVSFVFGSLIDVAMHLTAGATTDNYLLQWVVALAGIILMALGIALQITARTVTLAGEGIVLAISDELLRRSGGNPRYDFGNVKVVNDVTLVLTSVVLSLVFLGELAGVREGTVAASLLIGPLVKRLLPVLAPLGHRVLGNP